jgi:hypothetical protein
MENRQRRTPSESVCSSENVMAKFLNQFQEAIKFTMKESKGIDNVLRCVTM